MGHARASADAPPRLATAAVANATPTRRPRCPGSTNPSDPAYSNLAGWNANGRTLEIRIPWAFLGFADPSTKVVAFFSGAGANTSVRYDHSPHFSVQVHTGTAADAAVVPVLAAPVAYTWDTWVDYCYCQRFKQSAAAIVAALDRNAGRAGGAPAFPAQPQFCECTTPPPPPPPLSLKSGLLVLSVLTIGIFLVYAGIVRPVLERLVPGMKVSRWKTSPGRVALQALSAVLAAVLVGVLAAAFSTGDCASAWWSCALGWFYDDDSDSYGLFVVYILLLTWDSLELLFATCFIRWPTVEDRLAKHHADHPDAGVRCRLARNGRRGPPPAAGAHLPPGLRAACAPCARQIMMLPLSHGPSSDPSHDGTYSSRLSPSITPAACRPPTPATAPAPASDSSHSVMVAKPMWSLLAGGPHPAESASSRTSSGGAKVASRYFFVVAAHNSSAKLERTLLHLLAHVPPMQIVVADNGSTQYVHAWLGLVMLVRWRPLPNGGRALLGRGGRPAGRRFKGRRQSASRCPTRTRPRTRRTRGPRSTLAASTRAPRRSRSWPRSSTCAPLRTTSPSWTTTRSCRRRGASKRSTVRGGSRR